MSSQTLIAARAADEQPDTTEISALAEAAGYEVVGEVTQRRAEDRTYNLGRGKAEELMRRAAETEPDAVVYDGELTPGQTFSLRELLPDGIDVIDRTRLVLDLFAEGAGSRAATLQVELARLRYLKPRVREEIARDYAAEIRYHNEDDRRVLDLERRIEDLERALEDITEVRSERRATRRNEGFDLVALAGYTNAGKSTLLRRLADDLTVPEPESDHGDLDVPAAVEDRLFKTLDTTTRRATVNGRRVLLTDTVGFVEDLPHESVRSFRATIDAARDADAILLVVDASDDPDVLAEKTCVSLDAIDEPRGSLLPVLNKVDLLDDTAVDERCTVVHETVQRWIRSLAQNDDTSESIDASNPVTVSATEATGVDDLRARVYDALPTRETTIDLPNCGGAQALLSWAYDHGDVTDLSYVDGGERFQFDFAARPDVVAEAERKVETVDSSE